MPSVLNNIKWLLCGAILLFSLPSMAADAVFDKQQWVSRVLVLTGPQEDPLYIDQLALIQANLSGFEARSVVIVHYKDRLVKKIEGLSPIPFDYSNILRTTHEQRYMQQKLQTDDDSFSVVLVGFDGLTKQVWRDVVDPREIFTMIDAMPMARRKNEQ